MKAIRLLVRSVGIMAAILLGAGIAFTCFGPEAWLHRARAYVPAAIRIKVPAARVVACSEKEAPKEAVGLVTAAAEYVPGVGGTKILRATLTGILREQVERQMVEVLERGKRDHATDVELLIDSLGGNVDVGFHLAALLSESGMTTHCLAGRYTASAAFLVLQGCTDRVALPTSVLMEHRPYFKVSNDMKIQAEALQEYAEGLIASRNLMIELLAVRSMTTLGAGHGLSTDDIAEKLSKGDWYIPPSEAISVGLLDRVAVNAAAFQSSIEGNKPAAGSLTDGGAL